MWGEKHNGEIRYDLHPGQATVIQASARFKAAIAGTGGGKTALGPLWVMQQIHRIMEERSTNKEPILGLVIAPTFPVMARATAPTLERMFRETDLEGRYMESKNRYVLPRGLGTLWMLSADHAYGLEGGQFDFAWIDEGGQIKYDAWVAIQGRLGQRKGPVLITTTPYLRNWLYHKFFLHAKEGDPDYFVQQWASITNPAYPQAEYDRAQKTLAPQRFSLRYEGNFVKRAGLVYPDLDSCVQAFDPGELQGLQFGGIDFGWNDPFAALAACYDPDTTVLWVWYERYRRYISTPEHAKKLPGSVQWFADGSRPDSIHDLRSAGLAVRRNGVHKIMDGIDAVNGRIYAGTLKIHPMCIAVLAEAEEYCYPEKDDETEGDLPIGGGDHALDALRYMIANVGRLFR